MRIAELSYSLTRDLWDMDRLISESNNQVEKKS